MRHRLGPGVTTTSRRWLSVDTGKPSRVPRLLAKSRSSTEKAIGKAVIDGILQPRLGVQPDPDEYVRAAMEWHFRPETGSPFWLNRAKTLDFDPLTEVKSFADLSLFPNIVDELRDVAVEDLIPRGLGPRPQVAGIFESGGTTGAPKRVVMFEEWLRFYFDWEHQYLVKAGIHEGLNLLGVVPSGPHFAGEIMTRYAQRRTGVKFTVDLDPRWVKVLVAQGRSQEADAYAEHVIDQVAEILRTQDVGFMHITPPLLHRLARRDELVDLVNEKLTAMTWGGAHLDADSRHLYRTEVFPEVAFRCIYGSTMILGCTVERLGLTDDDPCVCDPPSPYITFSVVDPETMNPVAYGERGQVVMHHVSKYALLPNNLERDVATRIQAPEGWVGDSVADVVPVTSFGGKAVIEGVY